MKDFLLVLACAAAGFYGYLIWDARQKTISESNSKQAIEYRCNCNSIQSNSVSYSPIVITSENTEVRKSTPYSNTSVETTITTKTTSTYSPTRILGYWVVDSNGHKIKYVEEHVEYR